MAISEKAYDRMKRYENLKIQYRIYVHQLVRFFMVFTMFVRLAPGFFRLKLQRRFFSPEDIKILETKYYSKAGKIIFKTLSHLKGPVMKLGQLISYMPLGVPREITIQLEPLQDTVTPLAGVKIREIVEKELGQPVERLFKEWRDTPLATASVSQLHYARLPSGKSVVVKVKYPGLQTIIASDMKNLRLLTPLLKKWTGLANIKELLLELWTLIANEGDFITAARFQNEFAEIFKGDSEVVIPQIFPAYSSQHILTMEYIDGQPYEDFKHHATQEEKNRAAAIIYRFTAISVNRHFLFNADPHPGNYLFLDGKVCFLDFGFTKRFSSEFIDNWKEQSLAGCANDFERFKKANEKMGYVLNEETFDHRMMFELYRKILYDPWSHDRIYRYDASVMEKKIKALALLMDRLKGNRMPPEFVSIGRLVLGQNAVLADLNAECNWHQMVFPLIKEKNDHGLAS